MLLKNVAKGQHYFDMICCGLGYAQIAVRENASKRMVQHLAAFAVLSPDIVDRNCNGPQPGGLTPEWLKRKKWPELWSDQSKLIEQL